MNGGASGASEKEGEKERLSTAEHACLELIGHLAAPSFFQKLRTEEQLGYLVSAHVSRFSGALGLTLLVQSSTAAPRHLEARMTSWCHSFAQELEALSEEACAANALALATQYTEGRGPSATSTTARSASCSAGATPSTAGPRAPTPCSR